MQRTVRRVVSDVPLVEEEEELADEPVYEEPVYEERAAEEKAVAHAIKAKRTAGISRELGCTYEPPTYSATPTADEEDSGGTGLLGTAGPVEDTDEGSARGPQNKARERTSTSTRFSTRLSTKAPFARLSVESNT